MKRKPCNAPGCSRPRWAKGFCDWHQHLRTDPKKPQAQKFKRSIIKVASTLRPISAKMLEELSKYSALRKKYLLENPYCAVYPWKPSSQIHHKRGRGKYLNDVSTWLAVSHEGHRKIEENPEWAHEMGFRILRNGK